MSTTTNVGSQAGNPLNNVKQRRLARFSFATLQDKNPIPGQIRDPKEITQLYENYKLIPYHAGKDTTMDGLLYFCKSLTQLSNTTGSCINSIHTFGFSGKLKIERNEDNDFNVDDDYIDDSGQIEFLKGVQIKSATKVAFTQKLREHVIPIKSFKSDTELVYKYLKETGNVLLLIKHTIFLGKKTTTYELYPMDKFRKIYNDDKSITHVFITEYFDELIFESKRDYKVIPLYPKYKENKRGELITYTTAIHIHVPTTNPFYAFPDWFQAFLAAYNEFQDSDYQIKQSATNFTGQTFIEVEDDEMDISSITNESANRDGFSTLAEQLQANFSADADDPQTILFTTRPAGAKEAFVFQFKPNLNENYFKVKGQTNEESIISAFQWSKRFLGKNETHGFSANVFIDELRVKEVGVLKYVRTLALSVLNMVKTEAFKFAEITEFDNLKIGIETNFDALGDFILKGDREEGSKNNIQKHMQGKFDE